MNSSNLKKLLVISGMFIWLVTACDSATGLPKPQKLAPEDVGHYCNMIVEKHRGPKAQIFEKGQDKPLWFTSVRDGLIYWTTPGEAQNPVAFYVHDMGQAKEWNYPAHQGIWIPAQDAFFVINSQMVGGMGTAEAVPFGKKHQAENFIKKHGGNVVYFDNVPKEYLIEDSSPSNMHEQMHGDDEDYQMHGQMHDQMHDQMHGHDEDHQMHSEHEHSHSQEHHDQMHSENH